MEEELVENNKNILFLLSFYIIGIFLGLLIGYDIYILKTMIFKGVIKYEKNTKGFRNSFNQDI